MDGVIIMFILALVAYIPLATVLLYVWWKYGKGEIGVSIARSVFLIGSGAVLIYMLTI